MNESEINKFVHNKISDEHKQRRRQSKGQFHFNRNAVGIVIITLRLIYVNNNFIDNKLLLCCYLLPFPLLELI